MRRNSFILAVLAGAAAACRIVPPPPLVPFHAVTSPDERGTTSVMLVAGGAGQLLFGGGGWGLALRVEHQETSRTAVGVELSGGRGDQNHYADGTMFRHWLVGVRGYGRYSVDGGGPLALQYGAGLSVAATGLVTGTLDGATVVADENKYAVPYLSLAAALAAPLRHGRAFSTEPLAAAFGPPEPAIQDPVREGEVPWRGFRARSDSRASRFRTPRTELYLVLGLGMVVPLGDTNNRLSVDLSLGKALHEGTGIAAFTAADRQRVAR